MEYLKIKEMKEHLVQHWIENGVFCEGCGFFLGTVIGHPRLCCDCVRECNSYLPDIEILKKEKELNV